MAIGRDRARKRAAGIVFALLGLALTSVSFANPREYIALQVTTARDGFSQCQPSINDRGEIVYVVSDPRGPQFLLSTRRGDLAGPSGNLRFPDINRHGEVVWADLVGPGGARTFSTTRGEIGFGNFPVISGNGLVATETFDGVRLYRQDGTFVHLALDPAVRIFESLVHVRKNGVVLYYARDTAGIPQLWSTKRGQLTDFDVPRTGDIAANGRGDFVYTGEGSILFASDGTILWGDRAIRPDMNNHGDIVFCEFVCFEHCFHTQVLLLTRRPEAFRDDGSMRR
jgi:hypothetical protein